MGGSQPRPCATGKASFILVRARRKVKAPAKPPDDVAMPISGVCALCLEQAELLKSHYMPAALYPTRRQKAATIARGAVYPGRTPHLKDYLLCRDCESRFEQNGESEVLRWLAPKAREFSLNERLRIALPREEHADFCRFAAYEIGLDAVKFAYFAMSMVWRGAVHEWTLPDATVATLLDLGYHREIIRKFLAGQTAFPNEAASVIVLVCSDPASRSLWGLPSQNEEAGCENYRFLARGVLFSVLLGENIPVFFRDSSCVSPPPVHHLWRLRPQGQPRFFGSPRSARPIGTQAALRPFRAARNRIPSGLGRRERCPGRRVLSAKM
jgi:hypothetical protein